ncbi:MAG: cupredoxin domain-containing protein [Actinobacteria bacterium]|nr:cupredoxin domain-containing protein [Actinomycetota bacterium]
MLLTAVALLRPIGTVVATGDAVSATMRVDMSGFEPGILSAKARSAVKLRIVNPDSQVHGDGGGWHQFAIPELGLDVKVAPRSEQTVTFTPTAPGSYTFYCDVCCGGKANPSMRGTLDVSA